VIARNHILDIISAFRALVDLGGINLSVVPVPSLGPERLHVSIDVGPAANLRRLAREIGASEPEVVGCDGRTWLGADLRIGEVSVRLTSEHLRAAPMHSERQASPVIADGGAA
jgi:hypothetical protein